MQRSKQPFLSLLLILSVGASYALSISQKKLFEFTLQVAAFPESADAQAEEFINQLMDGGVEPIWGIVEIPGKGRWTRVFIGSFETSVDARLYGEKLISRRLIKEFVIKKGDEIKSLSRPRSVGRKDARALPHSGVFVIEEPALSNGNLEKPVATPAKQMGSPEPAKPPPDRSHPPPGAALTRPPTAEGQGNRRRQIENTISPSTQTQALINQSRQKTPSPAANRLSAKKPMTVAEYKASLPVEIPESRSLAKPALALAPDVDTSEIQRHDPVRAALNLLSPSSRVLPSLSRSAGGLWLSGDVEEALARLNWIVGSGNEDLLSVADDGKLQVNLQLLARRAGTGAVDRPVAPLLVANYLAANEGLLLLLQVTQSVSRYRLHLGTQAPTLQGVVNINGSINLDKNFDSRINPYRRLNKKLHTELPPSGFDCLIAINPAAKWFNMPTNRLVQVGNITFHELAEAHAKVELEYDYLPKGNLPGAHNMALEREMKLKAQRPSVNMVLTVGSNRVIKSDEELRQLTAETGNSRQQ